MPFVLFVAPLPTCSLAIFLPIHAADDKIIATATRDDCGYSGLSGTAVIKGVTTHATTLGTALENPTQSAPLFLPDPPAVLNILFLPLEIISKPDYSSLASNIFESISRTTSHYGKDFR
jgi:hypothetical protein